MKSKSLSCIRLGNALQSLIKLLMWIYIVSELFFPQHIKKKNNPEDMPAYFNDFVF